MKPIAIFYHCLFQIGDEILPQALEIIHEQMTALKSTGLEDAASEIHIGINAGVDDGKVFADSLLPAKAKLAYHGLESRAENLTIIMLENWAKDHPGWAVLYFHAKGSSHAQGSDYGSFVGRWRNRMMFQCVTQWRQCVLDLERFEAVGCHWLTEQGWDKSQHYFAGTYYWVRSEFFATIPSMYTRQRIKDSGIAALESRYEAEIVLGNGPRLPSIKNYYSGGIGT